MDKEKMDACKQRLQEAAHWGKSKLTPQRLKKGAGCLLVLAIAAGGSKIALHQAKAQSRAQEAQARTEMLQNMAAQKNIQLVSTDQVKENIASTLGTDPSSITFQSVTLDDWKPGEPGKDNKAFQKDRKNKKDKGQKKDSKKYKENDKRAGRQDRQGTPDAQDQNGRNEGREGMQLQGFPQPQMAKDASADAFPGIYVARCEKDGMRYSFLVDAQSGQILHGQVHKMNPIQQLFS